MGILVKSRYIRVRLVCILLSVDLVGNSIKSFMSLFSYKYAWIKMFHSTCYNSTSSNTVDLFFIFLVIFGQHTIKRFSAIVSILCMKFSFKSLCSGCDCGQWRSGEIQHDTEVLQRNLYQVLLSFQC